jgi:DNA polymerase elongation subunit (family B)
VFHVFLLNFNVFLVSKCNYLCCSMFVLLKGRSREEAIRIGKEIASSITAINPDPVTLKFEKVYHPCFLLTKKRYVGYSYESPEQMKPIFDAKGIETVRRDTCPAVAKILERSIRIMFEEQDLKKVRPIPLSPCHALSLLSFWADFISVRKTA